MILLLLAAGCGVPREVVLDLVRELPRAEVGRVVERIDLGTAQARPHLGRGWSFNEANAAGTTYVWGLGEGSEVAFYLPAPAALRATLSLMPFTYPGAPAQTVAVTFNRRPVGELVLRPGLRSYAVELPASSLRRGRNVLRFTYGYSASPQAVGAGNDPRPLAAAWDAIDLDGVPAAPGLPEATPAGLRLPAGSEVAYALCAPADAVLEVRGLSLRGGGRLEAWLELEGEGEKRLAGTGERRSAWRVDLPAAPGRPLRLALRAVAAGDDGDRHGVVLRRARLLGRAPAPPLDPCRGPDAPAAAGAPPEDELPRPALMVLYLVDTLRADRLGCYGGDGRLTPHLDALAADGVVFDRALAETSWTKPAVASVLTGLPPLAHGVHDPELGLPQAVTTVAERLRAAGWTTAAFVTSAHVTEASGFAQGFGHFDFSYDPADRLTARITAWLAERHAQPIFLFVHTVDPHAPFAPPESLRARLAPAADPARGTMAYLARLAAKELPVDAATVADLHALYGAEVAFADAELGELLAALRRAGRYDDALIVFLSDHGEAFHEHGVLGHGWDLYQEVLRIPLILKLPGRRHAGRRVARPVAQIDVAPTLLAAAGLAGGELPGAGLLAPSAAGERLHVAYLRYAGREGISVSDGRFKLILPLSSSFAAGAELYDLDRDPAERHNRLFDHPVRAAYLEAAARRALGARRDGAAPVTLSDEERTRLEALGYLGGDAR